MKLLTVAEAADRLSQDPETIRRKIRGGIIKAERVPGGREYRIDESDLGAVRGSTPNSTESQVVVSSSARNGAKAKAKAWVKGWDD